MGIRRFNDPNTGRWAPVLTHVSAVIGMNGKNLKTILEELQTKVDEGGIQDGSDIDLSEMEQGKMYIKDGKIYICISHTDPTLPYELISIGEDGIHQVGRNEVDDTYDNVIVSPDTDGIQVTSTGLLNKSPNEIAEWLDYDSFNGLVYSTQDKLLWHISHDGNGNISEMYFGRGSVKCRKGYSDTSWESWIDFSGYPIEYLQSGTATLQPYVYYVFGTQASLNITLDAPRAPIYLDEYMFEFESGSTPTTLALPSTIRWQEQPEIEANKKYQVSISRGIGLIVGVDVV